MMCKTNLAVDVTYVTNHLSVNQNGSLEFRILEIVSVIRNLPILKV